ncbi:hypothetical protein Taro_053318 [Colocasia esculenta]|uniref:Uncharacterized protein n=1 Tax=Colocasia esculenta TaxID=4460 RepID=A0A843XMG3_COLES|nr:hypothetical protein [Colocasia esculenta]
MMTCCDFDDDMLNMLYILYISQ